MVTCVRIAMRDGTKYNVLPVSIITDGYNPANEQNIRRQKWLMISKTVSRNTTVNGWKYWSIYQAIVLVAVSANLPLRHLLHYVLSAVSALKQLQLS